MLAILVCVAFLLVLAHAGHGVPCVFRMVTGWKCPGCGATTMCLSLLMGDIRTAFAANPFLFGTWPLLVFELLAVWLLPLRGTAKTLFYKVFPALYLAALVLFGIFRNGFD